MKNKIFFVFYLFLCSLIRNFAVAIQKNAFFLLHFQTVGALAQ